VQIFRHIAEKSDNAPYAQALCDVAVAEYPKSLRKNRQFCQLFVQQKYDKIKETLHRAVRRALCSVSYGYSGSYSGACFGTLRYRAIPHKERLATLHAICLQIFLQSLFRIFPHASCVHIFRDISGKYSKIQKGFSPFFPSSLKKSDDAICIRQIRNRLSYFTKMLVNTSSIHSAFCFI